MMMKHDPIYGCDYFQGFEDGRTAERSEIKRSVFKARCELVGNICFFVLLFVLGAWMGMPEPTAQKVDKFEQMSVRTR